MLVSILARPAGRALPRAEPVDRTGVHQVSILARPAGRALPALNRLYGADLQQFQSSPGPQHRTYDAAIKVSILARPAGRALAGVIDDVQLHRVVCFNPRPARGPGAARLVGAAHVERPIVSILAPARGPGAALDAEDGAGAHEQVSILARPAGRALPASRRDDHGGGHRCFNPRPARGPGAACGP